MKPNKIVMAVLTTSLVTVVCLSGCRHPRRDPVLAPHLPPVVILDEPYYLYGGFYYHYLDDCWYYSHHRSGPWLILPRNHYPKEIRYRDTDRDREQHRDRDEKSRRPEKKPRHSEYKPLK